jgi:hypothetical protein
MNKLNLAIKRISASLLMVWIPDPPDVHCAKHKWFLLTFISRDQPFSQVANHLGGV